MDIKSIRMGTSFDRHYSAVIEGIEEEPTRRFDDGAGWYRQPGGDFEFEHARIALLCG